MEHFKNKELDSMCNRMIAIMESLAHLGIYLSQTGTFNLTALQMEAGRFISKPEHDVACYAMDVMSRVNAVAEPASYYGEWSEELKKKVRAAQKKAEPKEAPKEIKEEIKPRKFAWIKTLFKNLFKVTRR